MALVKDLLNRICIAVKVPIWRFYVHLEPCCHILKYLKTTERQVSWDTIGLGFRTHTIYHICITTGGHIFADVSKFYLSFDTDETEYVFLWMEVLLIGSKYMLKMIPNVVLSVGNYTIAPTDSTWNIDAVFVSSLAMNVHIAQMRMLHGTIWESLSRSSHTWLVPLQWLWCFHLCHQGFTHSIVPATWGPKAATFNSACYMGSQSSNIQ